MNFPLGAIRSTPPTSGDVSGLSPGTTDCRFAASGSGRPESEGLVPVSDQGRTCRQRSLSTKQIWSNGFVYPLRDGIPVKWAWNKWNTYSLAQKLGLDIPKTWCPRTPKDLAAIDADFPLGIKPAVKEDFFYATKAKAWRANDREKLTSLWKEATVHSGFNEVLVQEIIPGDGSCQFSSCVLFKDGEVLASMEAQTLAAAPPRVRPGGNLC